MGKKKGKIVDMLPKIKNTSNILGSILKANSQDKIIAEQTYANPTTFLGGVEPTFFLTAKGLGAGKGTRTIIDRPFLDMRQIMISYYNDSYVRQSVAKFVNLIFKAGWNLKGKDIRAVEYLRIRLTMLADATHEPTDIFLHRIAKDLVLYGNVFIIKQRAQYHNLPKRIVINPVGDERFPVAGYFIAHPATVSPVKDERGKIISYIQSRHGYQFGRVFGSTKDNVVHFDPKDVIHIKADPEDGFTWGNSHLIPVMEDIKLLREVEENVARLVYRYTYPFTQIKVGLPQEGLYASEEEVIDMQNRLNAAPSDATWVTNERADIKVVGVQGEALDVEPYMKYFRERVFSGLGVSGIQMGLGETVNRSTSDTLTTEMHDQVKAYQKIVEIYISHFIFRELLEEGGFSYYINPNMNYVGLHFDEIETDLLVKLQNHTIFKYEHDAIDEDEMRMALGLDPITEEERFKMRTYRVKIPQLVAEGMARAGYSGDDIEQSILAIDGQPITALKTGTPSTNNKNQPQNQHGVRLGPKIKKEIYESTDINNFDRIISGIEKIVQEMSHNIQNAITIEAPLTAKLSAHISKTRIQAHIRYFADEAFRLGANREISTTEAIKLNTYMRKVLDVFFEEIDNAIPKHRGLSIENLKQYIDKHIRMEAKSKYLIDIVKRGYWYGSSLRARELGLTVKTSSTNGCQLCHTLVGKDLSNVIDKELFDQVPPYHRACQCTVEVMESNYET